MTPKSIENTLKEISKEVLNIELKTQNNDNLDFHEVAVWQLHLALERAFFAGYYHAKESK